MVFLAKEQRSRVLVQNPFRTNGSCIICEIRVICGQIKIRGLRRLTQIRKKDEEKSKRFSVKRMKKNQKGGGSAVK